MSMATEGPRRAATSRRKERFPVFLPAGQAKRTKNEQSPDNDCLRCPEKSFCLEGGRSRRVIRSRFATAAFGALTLRSGGSRLTWSAFKERQDRSDRVPVGTFEWQGADSGAEWSKD